MTILRAAVTLTLDSTVPQDAVVNTWHAEVVTSAAAAATEFVADLTTFYDALQSYLATNVANGASCPVKVYNLDDDEPRAPILEAVLNPALNPAGGTALPPQDSICLSFQADRISGQIQARRRGRVYLGPFGTNVLGSGGRVAAATVTGIVAAADALLTASDTATNYRWVVYSRTLQTGFLVQNGWVDDAFDTQRRRQLLPTAPRSTFT